MELSLNSHMVATKHLNKFRRSNRFAASFPQVHAFFERLKIFRYSKRWQKSGWSLPLPDLMKRAIFRSAVSDFGAEIFVETGTFRGGTPWELKDLFRKIYSIEVQPQLGALAKERFSKFDYIEICIGDSAEMLREIVKQVDGPSFFFLDGHYSGGVTGRGTSDCPIWGELDAISKEMSHPYFIIIDDARCFGKDDGYPSVGEISAYVKEHMDGFRLHIENDFIWLTPSQD